MSKVRRFRVESLTGLLPGDLLPLPADEAAHARVLRLKAGDAIELFDSAGLTATAMLDDQARAKLIALHAATPSGRRLILATAWPKGKRAALLVEKCSELGASAILPVRYARSVVSKDDESEGITRLRRIAAEAAKQSGRNDAPEILPEQEFTRVLGSYAATALCLMLDPRAERGLLEVLSEKREALGARAVVLMIGPEGGFSADELAAAEGLGITRVKMARHVLRVETAALAACAIAGAVLKEV